MGCKQVLNNFNVFYISHQIFFFCFVVLFMLHPIPGYSHVKGREWWLPLPYSWMWIAWPFALYILERLYGHYRAHRWDIKVMGASILEPGVLRLELSKPPGFKYKPGQYIFMQCNNVSRYEWHPFTLTSAPDDDFLQVYIRDAGDWTGVLHARFRASMQAMHAEKECLFESQTKSLEHRQSHERKRPTMGTQAVSGSSHLERHLHPEPVVVVDDRDLDCHQANTTGEAGKATSLSHMQDRLPADCPCQTQQCCSQPYHRNHNEHECNSMAGSAVFQPADTVVPKKLHLGGADLISQNIVVTAQRKSIDELASSWTVPSVPSGSYIGFGHSDQHGSQLHRMQAQRKKESTEAWRGMSECSFTHTVPWNISPANVEHVESVISPFRTDSFNAPGQAPTITIDGPFGAPSQEHANYHKLLLICTGIGVTPMLSIMRDALHRMIPPPSRAAGLGDAMKGEAVDKRKVFMHWIVRDPRAAGWLKSEFEVMSMLDSSGDIFRSVVHVTGGGPLETGSKLWTPDSMSDSNVQLSHGRPDFRAILKGLQVAKAVLQRFIVNAIKNL